MIDFISGDRQIGQNDFEVHVRSVAAALARLGVGEEDAVLILLRNDIEFLEASQAVTYLGGCVVALNWHGTPDDMLYIANDCGARAVIAHADLLHLIDKLPLMPVISVPVADHVSKEYGAAAQVDGHPNVTEWQDLLATAPIELPPKVAREPIIYTSGTTGKPKGVRRFPMTAPGAAEQMRKALGSAFGLKDGMRTLVLSPFYHAGPASYLRAAMATMKTGGLVVIHPRFDPEKTLQAIQAHRIDRLWMVPTMFVTLLKLPEEVRRKYDVSSLKHVIHTAAPCPVDVKKRMIEWFGPVIYEFYGSTEVGPVTVAGPQDALDRPGTVGRVTEDSRIVILDDAGEAMPAGEIGEIAAKNRFFPEFTYWNREPERRALDRGEFVATGDIGYFDGDGFLFLCDRKSHMIISGGVNIYPAEIESIALEHPKIKDCAAFGIPDEKFGEAIALMVEKAPNADLSEAEVSSFLKGRVASYKMPKLIQFHASLPREDSGKIFKRLLRRPFWEQTGRNI
jgi:long-chain acyl-CoA synthetase